MALRTIALRLDDDLIAYLEELAFNNGSDRSEVMRKFLVAGAKANPLTPEQRRHLRSQIDSAKRGELPGLVVPLAPPDLSGGPAMEKKGCHSGDLAQVGIGTNHPVRSAA